MVLPIKLFEMREIVQKEIEHIPSGDYKQNLFRQIYFTTRMNSLGKKAKITDDKNEVLKYCIGSLKEFFQSKGEDFIPQFDNGFFIIKGVDDGNRV